MSLARSSMAVFLGLALAACGGGDDDGGGGDNPGGADGGADGPDSGGGLPSECAEILAPVGTIDSYPGSFEGATIGGGADLSNPMGVCGENAADWYEEVGEDVVVALTGLEPGAPYAVTVDSAEDVGVYVVTGCQALNAGPAEGECLGYADLTAAGEQVGFVAPESGVAWAVVDSANLPEAPPTGAFTLDVALVECVNGFECENPDEPACNGDFQCTAGFAECTGDDANDDGPGGNDGPAAATVIDAPTVDAPTVVEAAACSVPATEEDWYKVDITDGAGLTAQLVPGGEADLDLVVFDDEGNLVDYSAASGPVSEQLVLDIEPGTYYILVYLYDPAEQVEAEAYTLTLTLPECETSYDCTDPAEPVCDATAACVAGPSECTSDDNAEAGGDDGPAGARGLNGKVNTPITRHGKICSLPASEADFFYFVVADGQGMDLELSWTDDADLDLEVFGDTGTYYGISFWVNPEAVSLSYLPAGTYWVKVSKFGPPDEPVAGRYTIVGTKRAAQTCTSAADCAAEYSTQLYRGDCTAGVCDFLEVAAPGADGSACDSGDDCTSGGCSYIPFEADAQDSVCTNVCSVDADCAAVGAGLTCTTGLSTNFCVPACTSDLECGADTGSDALDPGEPWDYITCTEATGACEF
jgi:hypothetical protein